MNVVMRTRRGGDNSGAELGRASSQAWLGSVLLPPAGVLSFMNTDTMRTSSQPVVQIQLTTAHLIIQIVQPGGCSVYNGRQVEAAEALLVHVVVQLQVWVKMRMQTDVNYAAQNTTMNRADRGRTCVRCIDTSLQFCWGECSTAHSCTVSSDGKHLFWLLHAQRRSHAWSVCVCACARSRKLHTTPHT
jgi:hypothetical protein